MQDAAPFEFARRALAAHGGTPLTVDLRLHPDDVEAMGHARPAGVTWDGPESAPWGGIRFCGFRVLPTQGIMPGTALVVRKPAVD